MGGIVGERERQTVRGRKRNVVYHDPRKMRKKKRKKKKYHPQSLGAIVLCPANITLDQRY